VRRLVLVLVLLAASYLSLGRLRRRRSRYLPAALAAVASVALPAGCAGRRRLGRAAGARHGGDYLTLYIEVTDLGVPVLSGVGVLMTLGAFVVLQRYLARRLPGRRVRRREPVLRLPRRRQPSLRRMRARRHRRLRDLREPRRAGTSHCAA
jgi:hypothetical protein